MTTTKVATRSFPAPSNRSHDDASPDIKALAFLIRLIASPILFQYLLWSVFGQDVPWYVDLAAGFVFFKYTLGLATIALVLRHCDFSIPLWESVKSILGYQ